MRIPTAVYIMLALGITLDLSAPAAVSAQVPAVERQPRAAVPAREGTIQATAPTAAPVAQTPSQPTVAPAAAAPADSAPVTAAPPPSGVTQLPPAAAPATSSTSSAATAKYAYGTAHFSLSLEGINVGPLRAVEGGAAVGTVVVDNLGPDNVQKKHVSGVRYEPLSFDVTLDAKPVVDWVSAAWRGNNGSRNGSIQLADQNYNVVAERQFTDAVITGTTVSAVGAAAGKTPVVLTVTVAPQTVREVGASGKQYASPAKAKPIMSSNFRFEMGDLETSWVQRIEPFAIGQQMTEGEVGMRLPVKQASTLEFPNLKIRMSARSYPNWSRWNREFLLEGRNGDAEEKNGAIVFLDQTLQKEVGRINLFNCGLLRLGGDRQEGMKDSAATVTADLYCEKMELDIKA